MDKIGYNMGCRMIDEFFARQKTIEPCKNFRMTAQIIAGQAFKMFLGVEPEIRFDADGRSCSFFLTKNPLAEFVVLPSKYQKTLWYSNVLCGCLRGALEMVNIKVNCYF